jgi:hypothetical protein
MELGNTISISIYIFPTENVCNQLKVVNKFEITIGFENASLSVISTDSCKI